MRMNALVVSAVMLLALVMPETGFAEIPKSEINISIAVIPNLFRNLL